jgi:amidophosphoribosyltransferase
MVGMLEDQVRDACGIVAAAWVGGPDVDALASRDAAALIPGMLIDMQNRGQLAAGLSSYHPERRQIIRTHKGLGPVHEALGMADRDGHLATMSWLAGTMAIGHNRYSTAGADDLTYAQPFERLHGKPFKWFAFCFNGQITNHRMLAERLEQKLGYHLIHADSDTEIFMHFLAVEQRGQRPRDWCAAFGRIARVVDGAWSMALLSAAGDLVVARDPTGIKPLCWGRHQGFALFASESVALQNLGVREIHDIEPGTMIQVHGGRIRERRFARRRRPTHCFFEWIYFANVASTIDGRSVYQARANLGRALARLEDEPVSPGDIVVPVPDTSKAAGDAFAFALGIPSIEGLVRNRYLGRTFIESNDRATKVRRKFMALRGILEGKRVFLVDDSIVRSTTLAYLIKYIRDEGRAAEVHVRIACPPIMSPCFYGIDMSTIGELFAPRHLRGPLPGGLLPREVRRAMAEAIGADSLIYLPSQQVANCIGLPGRQLCMACVTGRYPTAAGQRLGATSQADYRAGRRGSRPAVTC